MVRHGDLALWVSGAVSSLHQGFRTLDQLPIGQSAVVDHVGGGRQVSRRLMEMGLLPGTRVETIRRAPLGDPLKIRLRGYLLSLRLIDAAQIALAPGAETAEAAVGPPVTAYRFPPHAKRLSSPTHVSRVLVAGNPNSGKTTIFNALTGARAQVSNYPGVTVTRSSRRITLPDGSPAEVIDLPGTYSLTAHSPDEQVAVDAVHGRHEERPDVAMVVVDAGALERGLYLVLQIVETGVPVVVALNMIDEASASGADFDISRLAGWFGATVVPTVASKGKGLDALRDAVAAAIQAGPRDDAAWTGFPATVEREVSTVEQSLADAGFGDTPSARRSWAVWALLSLDADNGSDSGFPSAVREAVRTIRHRSVEEQRHIDQEIIGARYGWIETVVRDVRTMARADTRAWTNRIDNVLTHRVAGMTVFAVVMGCLFEALFSWSEPMIGGIEALTSALQGAATAAIPAGPLRGLVVDGVIAGVGNVVVFVPQIAMLFLFIAVLEDVGYLARVAFVIDRLMGQVGLHGRAFVPMLSGFACAIPAVMATRTIESRRDQLITMLTLPMVSCSARLPVYALVTAVVFSVDQRVLGILSAGAVVLFSMYGLSVVATLGAAAVLRRTVLRGPRLPLVLELPPYRVPVWRNIALITWRRVQKFLTDAGTIILTMTIIVWALLSFPKSVEIETRYDEARSGLAALADPAGQVAERSRLNGLESAEQIRFSVAGRVGQAVEPLLEPLGFDWRIGVGILGAFAAREVFVSTLGIVFGIEGADEESGTLRSSLQAARREDGSPLMTPLTGVSIMVFFVLACQCMSTIVVVRKESGTWGWPLFMFAYMSVLAYAASFTVYQTGVLFGWGVS
jgi:ferrous iron transport protein B